MQSVFESATLRDNMLECAVVGPMLPLVVTSAWFLFDRQWTHASFDQGTAWKQVKQCVFTAFLGSPLPAVLQHLLWPLGYARTYGSPLERGFIPLVTGLILYVILLDLIYYVIHRIEHAWPLLYHNIHATHHIHKPVTSLNTTCLSIADYWLTGVLPTFLPLFVVPMWVGWFPVVVFSQLLWTSYLHDVNGYKIPSSGVLLDNADHLLHHSAGMVNFALFFPIWDKVLGTYRAPGAPFISKAKPQH
jgi:sterol desaturase/sphingolipid hydroxylase (fatty acid hydroxylase superfamily)